MQDNNLLKRKFGQKKKLVKEKMFLTVLMDIELRRMQHID